LFFFVIASLLFSWHPNQNSEISFPGLHDSTLIESVERYIYGNIEEIIFDISISLLIVFFFTGIIAGFFSKKNMLYRNFLIVIFFSILITLSSFSMRFIFESSIIAALALFSFLLSIGLFFGGYFFATKISKRREADIDP
jgi:hypothetical protein